MKSEKAEKEQVTPKPLNSNVGAMSQDSPLK